MIKKKMQDVGMFINQEREYILSDKTDFFVREAYNTLRSNITFSLTDKGCKIVAVTSTNPGEGKSITALNISTAYAEINKKVLLVDCDLRKPKVHKLLKIKSAPGLSNVLIDEIKPSESIQTIGQYGIDVITAGDIPPNSTQLLESEQLNELLEYVKDKYDYVILDTPPINVVIDACILAKHTNGIIYVIKQSYAKKDHIFNAVRQLEFSQGKIIGFVLNDINDKKALNLPYKGKYKYKKYGYSAYGYTAEEEPKDASEQKSEVKKNFEKIKKMKSNKSTKQNKPTKSGGRKKRKYVLIGIAAAVAILAVSAAVFASYQKNNIQAFDYATKYTQEELKLKNEEITQKTKAAAETIPNVYIQPLTDEERKMLASGELTAEDAMKIITGTTEPEPEPTNKKGKKQEEDTPVKEVSKINELVAKFYLLKAEFLNNIDNLIAQGQEERHAIPKEERTLTVKLKMAKKYAKLGTELEEECDKKVASLIKELENELKAEQGDVSVIEEIKNLYNEEKALKKAELIEAYYPKG